MRGNVAELADLIVLHGTIPFKSERQSAFYDWGGGGGGQGVCV